MVRREGGQVNQWQEFYRTRSRRGFSRKAKTRTRTRRVVWSPRPTALLPSGTTSSLIVLLRGGGGCTLFSQIFNPQHVAVWTTRPHSSSLLILLSSRPSSLQ